MNIEEFLAMNDSSRSLAWPHRHAIRRLRMAGKTWPVVVRYLATQGVSILADSLRQWYARQDWEQIDAEMTQKPQAQAVARPAVPRPASPRPTPREPTQESQGLGLVEKYAPNPQLAGVDDDDNNPAHSVLAKFPGTAKRMQEKTDGNQS